jgi:hypothetical protein
VHTLASFLQAFPEFSDGSAPQNTLVQTKLDEAAEGIDVSVWGEQATTGHGYLTAHLLALSPMGNTAKLTDGGGTTYEKHYARLVKMVGQGFKST